MLLSVLGKCHSVIPSMFFVSCLPLFFFIISCMLIKRKNNIKKCVCVCSNANPLHYYVLRVLCKTVRWRWVWSIFESRTAWADHITCGTSICIVYCRKLRTWVHRCGGSGSMRACHTAGPCSIPGRDKFPGWGFFRGFSSPVRRMSGSFRPTRSPNIIWPS